MMPVHCAPISSTACSQEIGSNSPAPFFTHPSQRCGQARRVIDPLKVTINLGAKMSTRDRVAVVRADSDCDAIVDSHKRGTRIWTIMRTRNPDLLHHLNSIPHLARCTVR